MHATSNCRLSKYRLVETHVKAPVDVMTSEHRPPENAPVDRGQLRREPA